MTPLPPLLLRGDCLDELRRIPDESVDAIVTDPPYGLSEPRPEILLQALAAWMGGDRSHVPDGRGFMGKAWDAFVPPPAVWDECARILKPGGHLLAFAGSRTFDLMGLSIRLAGFEIRDSIAWLYGSGFPKSMDVSKAIDARLVTGGSAPKNLRQRAMGEDYEVHRLAGTRGFGESRGGGFGADESRDRMKDRPLETDAARAWEGWGTALKPAFEPIIVARKPLIGTVAANVLAHGTGGLNIDATRIGYVSEADAAQAAVPNPAFGKRAEGLGTYNYRAGVGRSGETHNVSKGRWPANVILDEGQAAALDAQSGTSRSKSGGRSTKALGIMNDDAWVARDLPRTGHDDAGGASRFFYVAKAPRSERPIVDGIAHPTVKPLALMRWLIRLVTPPGGVVVDPFTGSGTTLEAAYLEGFESIGVELTPDYWPLIEARIARAVEVAQRDPRA